MTRSDTTSGSGGKGREQEGKSEHDEETIRRRALEEITFSKGHAASSSVEGTPRKRSFHAFAKGALSLLYRLAGDAERKRERRPRILILHTSSSATVRNDEYFLSGMFDVRIFPVKQLPRRAFVGNLFHLTFWMLRNIWRAQGVFFRFVDYYAVVPAFFTSLLGKKLWIVLGGYDAHHLPQWNYGVYDTPLRAWCARYAIRRATHLLPVDESLWDGWNTYIDPPVRTGVKSLVSGIRAEVRVIPNGFDRDFWRPDPTSDRGRTALVVAGIPSSLPEAAKERTALLKGVWTILDVAEKLPDCRFTIVGTGEHILRGRMRPSNVAFAGYLAPGELRRLYRHTRVYAMPSMTEGMPASLAEAMLCECVPVGSNVNGIPRLIGEAGFVVERADPDAWAEAIRKAMEAQTGHAARERISREFGMERRRRLLKEVLAP